MDKIIEYDKHGTPYMELNKLEFEWNSSYYEVWQNNSTVDKQHSSIKFIGVPTLSTDIQKIKVSATDAAIFKHLNKEFEFDVYFTLEDRLVFMTLPLESNGNKIIQTHLLSMSATRSAKNFHENEPYACSIFTINGMLAKMSLSFCNPLKAIDFYP